MKFINFITQKEKMSITPGEIAMLIDYENAIGKEVTVSMVDPDFDYGDMRHKGNKLLVFHESTRNGEMKYVSYEVNGYETSGDFRQMLIGPFGAYENELQAITAVGHAYGAQNEGELANRRKIKFYQPLNKNKERER